MAKTGAERQEQFVKRRVKTGEIRRLELRIPLEDYVLAKYLAQHWDYAKGNQPNLTAAVVRALRETWQREGEPIPEFDGKGGSENTP